MEDTDTSSSSSEETSVQIFRRKLNQKSPTMNFDKKQRLKDSEGVHSVNKKKSKPVKRDRDIGDQVNLKKRKLAESLDSKVKPISASKHYKHGESSKGLSKASVDSESDDNDDSEEEGEDEQTATDLKGSNITEDEESEDEKEEEDKEYSAIKEELSHMSFEELQRLKEKLGLKVFNQVLRGDRFGRQSTKRVFKRENKNRPMEMSSKRAVPRFREIIPVKKKINRDPRFDDLSGEFNEHYFKKSYSFLDEVKKKEMEKVKKKLKKESNTERKQDLHYLFNRMKQQEMAAQQKQKRDDIEKEWKKIQKEKVQEGKKPAYLRKSDKRKLELAEKYKELKKSGKVDKYLTKKRKKNAQKEKKKLPTF